MRVLVTNTRHQQAYAIVTALRPYAERIVATIRGRNRAAAWLAPAARSRLVDARWRVPPTPAPWQDDRPSEAEERYVQALLSICRRERIDVIIPSRDSVAYILSRHRGRFVAEGASPAVCDFPAQSRAMDKWHMLETAQRAGIPIPRTCRARSGREMEQALAAVGLPAVVKPRFGAGGIGLKWVTRQSVPHLLGRLSGAEGLDFLVQEYIPGPMSIGDRSAYVVIDTSGRCKAMYSHHRVRFALRHVGIPFAAGLSTDAPALRRQTLDLLRALSWWGAACVEWKYDPRDGRTKLMEPNVRIGATVWAACAAGVNVPLILAQVALGQDPAPVTDTAVGRFYIDPVIDVLATLTYLTGHAVRAWRGPDVPPPPDLTPPLGDWLRMLARSYRGHQRTMSDYWRAWPRDPLPPLLYWLEQAVYACRRWRDSVPHW